MQPGEADLPTVADRQPQKRESLFTCDWPLHLRERGFERLQLCNLGHLFIGKRTQVDPTD